LKTIAEGVENRGAVAFPAGTWMRRNSGLLVSASLCRQGDPGDFGERISIDQEYERSIQDKTDLDSGIDFFKTED